LKVFGKPQRFHDDALGLRRLGGGSARGGKGKGAAFSRELAEGTFDSLGVDTLPYPLFRKKRQDGLGRNLGPFAVRNDGHAGLYAQLIDF
jgi:hypothetical protein